ncbi:hypothetical protein SDRG_10664 [Saprolegnia diclina VS20]|uniref:AAA+ ATPase domain-containing protein n=1 Tax=Saprolegnia diclina (strain VS20) TaxID=1156394 RepID=T0RGT0_SAPDV|nr:hypothetical protein SDRG_10664 [Saprolegnia diclina VS20]EQC31488.1 hypothetical protein SDRG_10664 [Saprolegnia diclina VS20]|eukprot:XP_008614887.1 hypothetical protein SDRG_10664 [Saprolegnia diclina VS20]
MDGGAMDVGAMESFLIKDQDQNLRVRSREVSAVFTRFDLTTFRVLVMTIWVDHDVRKSLDEDGSSSLRDISAPKWSPGDEMVAVGDYFMVGDDLLHVIMGASKSCRPMTPSYNDIIALAPLVFGRIVVLCTHELPDASEHARIVVVGARELESFFQAVTRSGRAAVITATVLSMLNPTKATMLASKKRTPHPKTHPRLSSVQNAASPRPSSPRLKPSTMKTPKTKPTHAVVVTRRDVAPNKPAVSSRLTPTRLLTSADHDVVRQYKAALDLTRAHTSPDTLPFFVAILKQLGSKSHKALQEPSISYDNVKEYVDVWQPLLVAETAHATHQGFEKYAKRDVALVCQERTHHDVWRFSAVPWNLHESLHMHDVVRLKCGRTQVYGIIVGQDQADKARFFALLEDGARPQTSTKWSVVFGVNLISQMREFVALSSLGQVPATLRRMILQPTHAASVRCTVKKHDASLRKLRSTPGSTADMEILGILRSLDDTAMTLGEFYSTRILATVQDLGARSDKNVTKAARALSIKWSTAIEFERATNSPPRLVPRVVWHTVSSQVDDAQRAAIKEILNSPAPIALLQGPPGTGKTTASVALANCLATTQLLVRTAATRFGLLPVLIAAPSNKAAFGFATRLLQPECLVDTDGSRTTIKTPSDAPEDQRFTMVVNAKPDLVPKVLKPFCLTLVVDKAMDACDHVATLLARRKEKHKARDAIKEALNLNNSKRCERALRTERNQLGASIKEIAETIARIRLEKTKTIVGNTTFVVGTLSSLGNGTLDVVDHGFAAIIVDEAAQAVELSALLAFRVRTCRHIFIGDVQQLRATVTSEAVKRAKYGRSLFERLEIAGVCVSKLQIQYRMHPLIAHFSSTNFYDGNLKSGRAVFARLEGDNIYKHPTLQPFACYDVRGEESYANGSFYNNAEAVYITDMVRHIKTLRASATRSYAILSPYKGQVELLRENVAAEKWTDVQGHEADIVLLSTVRVHEPGFLTENPRANVALTRSRSNIIVVGHAELLTSCSIWRKMVQQAVKLKTHFVTRNKSFIELWNDTETDAALKAHHAKVHKALLEMYAAAPDGCVGLRSLSEMLITADISTSTCVA